MFMALVTEMVKRSINIHNFAAMTVLVKKYTLIALTLLTLFPSCMLLDGSNSYRKKNKCCGIIKCDIHRRSSMKKHKRVTNAHRSVKKREHKIKHGY